VSDLGEFKVEIRFSSSFFGLIDFSLLEEAFIANDGASVLDLSELTLFKVVDSLSVFF
jgi:hypothetical protein